MDPTKKISLGTTTIAFQFRDGIIICADSRTSSDTRIANRVSRKLVQINDHCMVATSGSAADTRFLCRIVRDNIYQQELGLGKPALIRSIAQLFAQFNHEYKDILLAGLLVVGVDEEGFHCFKVIPGGTVTSGPIISSGSGSTYIMGLMDKSYRPDMTEEEAVAFGKELVNHACYRDGSSGGVYRWTIVAQDGVRGDADNWE